MNLPLITEKANTLIEALPYIQNFKGATFVIKYGGAFMDDPNPKIRDSVATDIAFLSSVGINVVIVHGGGKAISRAMKDSGLEAVFKNGLRVTDEETVKIVEKTLNEGTNLEICRLLYSKNCKASSVKGNSVLKCQKQVTYSPDGEEIDLGYVGKVVQVDEDKINEVLKMGKTPVISPIALDDNNHPYNTNADEAASAVAAALKARRLFFLCDVPGLMKDPKDETTLISTLNASEVPFLKEQNIISGGMAPKVDSAIKALKKGVRRVHFVNGYLPHSLLLEIFTDKGIGTEILHD